jgi:hypothetical protein
MWYLRTLLEDAEFGIAVYELHNNFTLALLGICVNVRACGCLGFVCSCVVCCTGSIFVFV